MTNDEEKERMPDRIEIAGHAAAPVPGGVVSLDVRPEAAGTSAAIPSVDSPPPAKRGPGERLETMLLNIGPSHPAMHGTLRVLVELEGETILHAIPEIGYLHRCFEKSAEKGSYTQVIPFTDRLNYCSALLNNVGYVKAVEKLMGVEITPRCAAIRVIVGELSRIMDHFIAVGTNIVDIGALSNFWYLFNKRERIYNVIEALTGARLTTAYTRIGGLAADLNEDFVAGVRELLVELPPAIREVEKLVGENRIFLDRTVGVGAISAEEAVAWGWTGPSLRACGYAHDLRKRDGYYGYNDYAWDVPVGENGDTFDRIFVRIYECYESLRIVEQAIDKLPDGPVNVSDPRVILPPKAEVYGNIEGLMNHFKLIMEGIKPPAGECYDATESANGELGFHIVSDGTGTPYKVKVRSPSLALYATFPRLIKGLLIADATAIIGSLNIVAGELDR
jgi:NADH dehydrogenase I D subunit